MARLPSKSNHDRRLRIHDLPWTGIAKSWLRRTRQGLLEGAIALVAIGVFGSLFIHVFRDVFSPDIARLAPTVVRGCIGVACLLITTTACLMVRRVCQRDVTLGWFDFSILSGISPKQAGISDFLVRTTLAMGIGLITGGLLLLIDRGALNISHTWTVLATTGLCLTAGITAPLDFAIGRNVGRQHPGKLGTSGAFNLVSHTWRSPNAIMIRWRTGLLLRQPATWGFWAGALLAAAATVVASGTGIPTAFVAIFAWLAGWLIAVPLALQAASETTSIHFEYSLGVTPHQVARSYAGTSLMLALISAALTALICAATNRGDAVLAAIASAAMAPSLMPFLLWQIDVRRPLIQMLTCLMASLFVATAIIATKVAFLLWPAVLVFLAQEQSKRLQAQVSGEREGHYT